MRNLYLLFFTCFAIILQAQKSPVSWKFNLISQATDKALFTATASISKGWNIYAVYMSDEGPIPTSFTFETIYNGKAEGQITEVSPKIKGYDDLFGMDVIKFKEEAIFTQLFTTQPDFHLKGYVTYMCCDNERCLPPANIEFDLKQ